MSSAGRLGRRMRRILLLVPYVIKHPGVTLDELAERFDVKKADLRGDLELLWYCGLPGYTPGDLMDVVIEDDRVYINMADYFSLPLRLTPAEGLALYAGGAAIAGLPEMGDADSLKRALGKLARALGSNDDGEDVAVQIEAGSAEHIAVLRAALLDGRRVAMSYLSATKGELSEREVDPWGLVTALGHVYLVGLDHLSGEERMFRTDRMQSVEVLEAEAPMPSDFDPERYKGAFLGSGGERMTLELSPSATRWFADYYPIESSEPLKDGWTRVTLSSGGPRWAATLLLRLGDDCRNVEPATVRKEAADLARGIAALYG